MIQTVDFTMVIIISCGFVPEVKTVFTKKKKYIYIYRERERFEAVTIVMQPLFVQQNPRQ
jgi:hypothetical protein